MERERRIRPANLWLAALIGLSGVVCFVVTVRSGRADSALLFVAFPVALAVALALTPGRSPHGKVFRITTIALLLSAVWLHEGAICVLLAAPLVYLVAHAATAAAQAARRGGRRTLALLPLPLLLAGGVEGTNAGWRVHPDQSVEVTRTIAVPAERVAVILEAGPQPTAARSLALRLLDVPMPVHVHGDGLRPGDRWTFVYHGGSHGPGGDIVTEVRDATPRSITWAVVEDTSITNRWVGMRDATLSWHTVAGGTAVRLRIDYRRGLDPSWYFGPLQDRFMHAGADHLLDMLALR
nr:SRPBCC family protein [Actinoplanes siamensis]